MVKLLTAIALCLFCLGPALGAPNTNPIPPGRSRCPQVRTARVDLEAYQGRWYQIVTDANSYRRFGRPDRGGSCVTANYTLRDVPTAEGFSSIDLLNCQYLRVDDQVSCAAGSANATGVPGRLTVRVNPALPSRPYLILDIFGSREQGYSTALIYSCFRAGPDRAVTESFFIISRTPRLRFGFLERLLYYLRFQRRGIQVIGRDVFFPHNNCTYFDTVSNTVSFFER